MPRRRIGRAAKPLKDPEADREPRYLSDWGLRPEQWRPVGSMARVGARAVLLWRLDDRTANDVALRARRAYDRLGELGVTLSADATGEGIEVTLPLSRVGLALRLLADRSILPDAVLLGEAPADELRVLRREVGSHRRTVELVIGHEPAPDAVAQLRSRIRAG